MKIKYTSIIGMGAIVTHDVLANSIVAGNSARVVKAEITGIMFLR